MERRSIGFVPVVANSWEAGSASAGSAAPDGITLLESSLRDAARSCPRRRRSALRSVHVPAAIHADGLAGDVAVAAE